MQKNLESLTYYAATRRYPRLYPALQEDLDVDVVIIGGGFSGINTALELAEKGITNIAILEARYLGYGATGRNGGQVMAGIGHDLEKIRRYVGTQGLETIFKISNLGAGIIRERVERYQIDADLSSGYCYLAFNARQEKTLRSWLSEFSAVAPEEEIALYC
ncbi:MAG: NAD(P)/FAD-dependent oxidoreductase, partial [Enterobacteriaceae bacterium]